MLRKFRFQAVIAAGLLAIVFWRAKAWNLPSAVGDMEWPAAVAVLSINIPIVALWSLRSHWVLAKLGYRLAIGPLVLVTTVGNVAGTLTPAGAGDLLRGVALKEKHGVSGVSATSAVLYERLYLPLLMSVAIGLAGAVQAVIDYPWAVALVVVAGVAAAAGGGYLYVLVSAAVRSLAPGGLVRKLGQRAGNWLRFPAEVDEVLVGMFRDMKLGLGFSLLTMLVYSLTALQVWLVLEALGAEVTVMEAWIAFALASLAGMLVMLPGGLGIWDAALPAILTSQGVDLLSATAATLLLRGLQTLPLGLLAVAAYLALSRRDHRVPARQEPASDLALE